MHTSREAASLALALLAAGTALAANGCCGGKKKSPAAKAVELSLGAHNDRMQQFVERYSAEETALTSLRAADAPATAKRIREGLLPLLDAILRSFDDPLAKARAYRATLEEGTSAHARLDRNVGTLTSQRNALGAIRSTYAEELAWYEKGVPPAASLYPLFGRRSAAAMQLMHRAGGRKKR
jgi:hypothetical protein